VHRTVGGSDEAGRAEADERRLRQHRGIHRFASCGRRDGELAVVVQGVRGTRRPVVPAGAAGSRAGKSRRRSYSSLPPATTGYSNDSQNRHAPRWLIRPARIARHEVAARNRASRLPATDAVGNALTAAPSGTLIRRAITVWTASVAENRVGASALCSRFVRCRLPW